MACSGPLIVEVWLQATLSTRCGGLGLRSMARHSVAGYAASLWAITPLYKDMDPGYDFNTALNLVNMALPPADHLPVPALQPVRQQELSRALDRVVVARLAAPAPGRVFSSCNKKARGRGSMLSQAPPWGFTW